MRFQDLSFQQRLHVNTGVVFGLFTSQCWKLYKVATLKRSLTIAKAKLISNFVSVNGQKRGNSPILFVEAL
jgi:hypothetical protein